MVSCLPAQYERGSRQRTYGVWLEQGTAEPVYMGGYRHHVFKHTRRGLLIRYTQACLRG